MKWDQIGDQQCSVARSSMVLGDRWSLLILSDCFLGVKRFDMLQDRLDIPRTTLANRLKRLESHDVLYREKYQSNPDRFEYRLTRKGLDLFPVISAIVSWGDQYYADEAGPPIIRRHKSCGSDIQPVLACPECKEPIGPHDIKARKREPRTGFAAVARGPVNAG